MAPCATADDTGKTAVPRNDIRQRLTAQSDATVTPSDQRVREINLCLQSCGRRQLSRAGDRLPGGNLADRVRVEPRDAAGISLQVTGEAVPEGRDNLAWRAVEVYQQLRRWPEGAAITLVKNVPVGAGLGGGSSDAAAVMQGLAELDPQPPDAHELAVAMATLGSDVPFFLTHGTAFGRSRGDELVGLADLPPCWIVLTRPDFSVSTREAYELLEPCDFTDGGRAHQMADAIDAGAEIEEIAELVANAFARPLTERRPVFGTLKQELRAAGALAAEITGSGSALFGLFREPGPAEAARAQLVAQGRWARVVRPVPVDTELVEGVE